MTAAIGVAVCGAMGSLARYGIGGALNGRTHPLGTVGINIVGAFALGMLVGLWEL